jgi:hypothetical protein
MFNKMTLIIKSNKTLVFIVTACILALVLLFVPYILTEVTSEEKKTVEVNKISNLVEPIQQNQEFYTGWVRQGDLEACANLSVTASAASSVLTLPSGGSAATGAMGSILNVRGPYFWRLRQVYPGMGGGRGGYIPDSYEVDEENTCKQQDGFGFKGSEDSSFARGNKVENGEVIPKISGREGYVPRSTESTDGSTGKRDSNTGIRVEDGSDSPGVDFIIEEGVLAINFNISVSDGVTKYYEEKDANGKMRIRLINSSNREIVIEGISCYNLKKESLSDIAGVDVKTTNEKLPRTISRTRQIQRNISLFQMLFYSR